MMDPVGQASRQPFARRVRRQQSSVDRAQLGDGPTAARAHTCHHPRRLRLFLRCSTLSLDFSSFFHLTTSLLRSKVKSPSHRCHSSLRTTTRIIAGASQLPHARLRSSLLGLALQTRCSPPIQSRHCSTFATSRLQTSRHLPPRPSIASAIESKLRPNSRVLPRPGHPPTLHRY
jgi:hypothetical protein